MITQLPRRSHPSLPGIAVMALMAGESLKRGEPQHVLVEVPPDGEIPLHTHKVRARMFVVAGDAKVLSNDQSINGRMVGVGDVVDFEPDIGHGFQAGPNGMRFVSENGGIVGDDGWDMQMLD